MLSIPEFPLSYVRIWATKTGCSSATHTLKRTWWRITSELKVSPKVSALQAGHYSDCWYSPCLVLIFIFIRSQNPFDSKYVLCGFPWQLHQRKTLEQTKPKFSPAVSNSEKLMLEAFWLCNLQIWKAVLGLKLWFLLSYETLAQYSCEMAQTASFLNTLPISKCWQILEWGEEILWKIIGVQFTTRATV